MSYRKKILLWAFFLFFLGFSSSSAPLYSNEATEIEPGWRVGPIIITMVQQDIERVYGKGEIFILPDPETKAKLTLLQYKQLGLNFVFKGQEMKEIEINYPNFQVKNLIKVGSGKDQVESVMGKNYIQENYKHSYEVNIPDYKMTYDGIIFYMKSDRVNKITVTHKK